MHLIDNVMPAIKFTVFVIWIMLGVCAARADDLACWISVASSKPKPDQSLPAELVLKNTGPTPIRICTLCGGNTRVSKGAQHQYLAPGQWVSQGPPLEVYAAAVVTIQPGGTARIPFDIDTSKGLDEQHRLRVTAAYEVFDPKFTDALHLWKGRVTAEPVEIKIE